MTRSAAFRPPFDRPAHRDPRASVHDLSPAPSAPPAQRVPAQRGWVERLARRYPVVDVLREDRQRNDGLTAPGFQALAAHRLSAWARSAETPRWARVPVGRVPAHGKAVVPRAVVTGPDAVGRQPVRERRAG